MDNKTKILLVSPVILIILLAVAAYYVPFSKKLSGSEKDILNFSPEDLLIKDRANILISKRVESPVKFGTDIKPSLLPKDDLVKGLDYNDTSLLSLVVISGKEKIAIINGNIFKEGDTIDDMKISKIEPGRVLLKNKESKWIYMEKGQ